MRNGLAVAMIVLMLTGCAVQPPKQLSRDEWIATTNRIYPDVDKDKLIAAAEKVLRLVDGDDFAIQHTNEGFNAVRNWTAYAVIAAASGTDYWNFTVAQTADGNRASLHVSTMSSAIMPMAVGGPDGGETVFSAPAQGAPIDGNLLYDVFWSRLDYLLGKSDKWLTCDDVATMRKSGPAWGNDDPICNSFNIKDLRPDHAMVTD